LCRLRQRSKVMRQKKTPIAGGFSNTAIQRDCVGGKVTTSKQLQPAMTISLYTKPITSRKQKTLISLMHCELSPRFVADHQDKNESKLLNEWDNTAYCPSAVMTMVSLARQGNPSNGLIYISQERAVTIRLKSNRRGLWIRSE
jgi:hypothetical protein